MNYYDYYLLSPSDRFKTFMKTLSVTNRTPEYYVNWDKVEAKTGEYELELNTLNYLVGKDDVVTKARELFLQQPNLLKAIPSLIEDRKSTRLNSSHVAISYAVFCLKKKKI